jgi:hypothetical protein
MIVKCTDAAGVSYYGNVYHHTFFDSRSVKFSVATGSPETPLVAVEFTDGECSLLTEAGVVIETRSLRNGGSVAQ